MKAKKCRGLVQQGDFFALYLSHFVLILPQTTLQNIIDDSTTERLTKAEKHLAIQLALGESLKTSADADGVGYETKRTHFKVLSAKLGLRGQSEVVRVLTTRVFSKLAHLAQPQMRADLDDYVRKYLPSSVRQIKITTTTGLEVPIFDYGAGLCCTKVDHGIHLANPAW